MHLQYFYWKTSDEHFKHEITLHTVVGIDTCSHSMKGKEHMILRNYILP